MNQRMKKNWKKISYENLCFCDPRLSYQIPEGIFPQKHKTFEILIVMARKNIKNPIPKATLKVSKTCFDEEVDKSLL